MAYDDPYRTLFLLRHAKAADGDSDAERALTAAGRKDAAAIGDYLDSEYGEIDAVICSTAERARQTLASAIDGGLEVGPVTYDRTVYNASVRTLVDLVGEADEEVRSLLLVGHAPGVPGLAEHLADEHAAPDSDPDHESDEPPPYERMSSSFPTSALAVLSFRGDWSDLDASTATVEDFFVGRG